MAQCVAVSGEGGYMYGVSGDPMTCSFVVLSGTDYAGFVAGSTPDYGQAAEVFSFFFFSTLTLWLLSKSCGIVVSSIKKL
jgi:hypothetical protein